jgi:hypothetical protein
MIHNDQELLGSQERMGQNRKDARRNHGIPQPSVCGRTRMATSGRDGKASPSTPLPPLACCLRLPRECAPGRYLQLSRLTVARRSPLDIPDPFGCISGA